MNGIAMHGIEQQANALAGLDLQVPESYVGNRLAMKNVRDPAHAQQFLDGARQHVWMFTQVLNFSQLPEQ